MIKYYNKREDHNITINIEDAYLKDEYVFLDPIIMKNGIFKAMKKHKLIKEITGIYSYNYVDIPMAKLNMGKLRKFDNQGVQKFRDSKDVCL